MNKLLIFYIFFISSATVLAEDRELAKLFTELDIDGTIVISSLHSGQSFIHNNTRASHRFTAASTFKVLNVLISIEEKAISGKDTVIKWDGHIYNFKAWNGDQTLESAFKISCVWCFQYLAHRVGAVKYSNYIHKLSYGKLREPFEETTFWLDGSLRISAIEQINFLKELYRRSLPFSRPAYELLQEIMVVEKTSAFIIRAKTGWATRMKPKVGWYIGYVETKEDVWFFATNININNKSDLPLRQQVTREALKVKGIIADV